MNGTTSSRERGSAEGFFVALAFLLLAAFMVVLGMHSWLPSLASRHGLGIDRMLTYLLATTGAIAIGGHVILALFVWRFSRNGKITHRLATPRSEKIWSILPGLLMTIVAEGGVLALGMPVWDEYFSSSAPPDAVTVEVTAEQFSWNVRYPGEDGVFGRTDPALMDGNNRLGLDREDSSTRDDVVSINRIALPAGRPARIRLRSKDVIHSFFLPNLRVKQDAVPGMTIEVWFVPTEEGRYELACTELCGLAHYYMKGTVDVLAPDEFERWLAENAAES